MSLAGTPAYMAPEIWGGEGGPASDLYSLAFAYVELRQGRSPLKPRPMVELMIAHQEGSYEFTNTVTEPERAVLRKALSAKPQNRHATCTDFAAALAGALGRPFAGGGHRVAGRGKADGTAAPYFGSAAAFESGSLPMPVDTEDAGGTMVIDSLKRKPEPKQAEPEPEPEPKRPTWPLLAAGTLALIAVVAVGVLLLTWGGTKPGPTDSVELTTKKTDDPDPQPKPKPVDPDPQPKPKTVDPIEPKPKDPINPKPFDPIPPPRPVERLAFPAGTTPEPGTNVIALRDRKVPEWVIIERGGEKVRFRCILASQGMFGSIFYVMETKVTNKLYSGGDDKPAVNVTAADARAFALKTFGGDLPTAFQWDHASGFYEHKGGDAVPLFTGLAWLDKDTPGSVKRTAPDVNLFGLLDMGGNGREWTRTVLPPFANGKLGETRDLVWNDLPGAKEKLILRSRSFTLDRPLTYALLKNEINVQPQAALATEASPITGFRVVLPLP